jgi:hypothetical protein
MACRRTSRLISRAVSLEATAWRGRAGLSFTCISQDFPKRESGWIFGSSQHFRWRRSLSIIIGAPLRMRTLGLRRDAQLSLPKNRRGTDSDAPRTALKILPAFTLSFVHPLHSNSVISC